MNKGFTLVELAIVIIIIGAILGGVMQGAELVNQGKNRAQIKQIEEYEAATLTFRTKYNYLPGDVPAFYAANFGLFHDGSATRNGNNVIDDHVGNIPTTSAYNESYVFFQHLSEKNLIKDYVRHQGNNYSIGVTFPEAKIGIGGVAVVGLSDGIYWFLGPTVKNNTGNLNQFVQNSVVPSLTPEQAFTMDQKIDDGIPSQGTLRAIIVTGSNTTNFTNDTNLNSCLGSTNQVYNIANSANLCRIIIKAKGF
jgi:prepilin-type N-terminal cleavage/methylation domain-containing protein